MRKIFPTLASLLLLALSNIQAAVFSVSVNTNAVLVAPTNLWTANDTNIYRSISNFIIFPPSTVPGGSSGQLQYNSAGTLGGVGASSLQAHTNLSQLGWPVYNVKNFGAVGDGSTDDTAAIQATANAVQSSTRPARLYYPAGLYQVNASINITNSNVVVFGDGPANSTIRVTTSGIGQAILVNNSAARLFNVHFSGIRIEATNGLASPPDGIKFSNASEWTVEDFYGTGLNNGVVNDACETARVLNSTFSTLKSNGVYNTVVNSSGFGLANTWVENCLFYQNSNACVLIDGPSSKMAVINSTLESTPNGIIIQNRETTDVEIDVPLIFNNEFRNATGSGFEGGRFILARANGITNYFIIQGLGLLANKSTTTGASNAVEFVKGANTNTATAFFNTRAVNNMFAGVTVSAIYSDTSLRIHTADNWIQSGLPESSGSVIRRWFAPPLVSMEDTNRLEQSLILRTAGNDINFWAFSTNSGMGFYVFDTTKNFYWDIGGDGNDLSLSANSLDLRGGFTATNYVRANSVSVTNAGASKLIRTDPNFGLAAVAIGANISFDGTTLSATASGGGSNSLAFNGTVVSPANIRNVSGSGAGTNLAVNIGVTGSNVDLFVGPVGTGTADATRFLINGVWTNKVSGAADADIGLQIANSDAGQSASAQIGFDTDEADGVVGIFDGYFNQDDPGLVLATSNDYPVSLGVNGSERFRLTSSGLQTLGTYTNIGNAQVHGSLAVTNGITGQSIIVSNVAASSIMRLDASQKSAAVSVGSGLAFDGTTLSATGGGGGGSGPILDGISFGEELAGSDVGSFGQNPNANTYGPVVFNTGASPLEVTLPSAGTYEILASFYLYQSSSFSDTFKLRNTTAGSDLAGELVADAYSGQPLLTITLRGFATTVSGNNVIQIYGKSGDATYGSHYVVRSNSWVSYHNLGGGSGSYVGGSTFVANANFNSDTNIQFSSSGTNVTANATNMVRLDSPNIFTGANVLTNLGNTISGNGTGLTNLNASNLASGTVNTNRISGLGTAQLASNAGIVGGQLASGSVSETKFAFTDITTSNATTSMHGLMPKLDGNTNHFFDGLGNQRQIALTGIQTNGATTAKFLGFDGSIVSWQTPAGGSSVYANGVSVSNPNFTNSSTAVLAVSAVTNLTFNPTNLANAQIAAGAAIAYSKLALGASLVWADFGTFLNTNLAGLNGTNIWSGQNQFNDRATFNGDILFGTANTSAIDWSSTGDLVTTLNTNASYTLTFSGSAANNTWRDHWVTNTASTNISVGFPAAYHLQQATDNITNINVLANSRSHIRFFRANGGYEVVELSKDNPLISALAALNATTNAGLFAMYNGTNIAVVSTNAASSKFLHPTNVAPWFAFDDLPAGGSGNVTFADFNTNQFNTNNATWKLAIKSGALATNMNLTGTTLAGTTTNTGATILGGTIDSAAYAGTSSGTLSGLTTVSASTVSASSQLKGVDAFVNSLTLSNQSSVMLKTTGTTVTNAISGTDYLTGSSTNTMTNKLLDGEGTGNVIANVQYFYPVLSRVTSGITGATNDWTATGFGEPIYSGSVDTNDYVVYKIDVPRDVDTATEFKLDTLKMVTAGTDADVVEFRFGMATIADSAPAYPTTFSNYCVFQFTPSSPAANDLMVAVSDGTLTNWAAATVAGKAMLIQVQRANNSNDDAMTTWNTPRIAFKNSR